MAEFSRAVSALVQDYARQQMSAEELLEEILLLDEAYFSLHGADFKAKLERALLATAAKSPRERVEARQAFYEVFFDHAVGIAHKH